MLDKQGEALYRMNFRVHGLADQTAYFQRKGGKLVIGDPSKVPYVNVNLWPTYGVALELNGIAPGTPATPPAPPTIPATAFASNPVFKIAFVVSDLDRAVSDYADLFGIDAASATRVNRPIVFPEGFAGERQATIRTATLRFPNGVALELNEPQGKRPERLAGPLTEARQVDLQRRLPREERPRAVRVPDKQGGQARCRRRRCPVCLPRFHVSLGRGD